MNYRAMNTTLGNQYEGELQVFKLFRNYGCLSGDGKKSLVGFSHRSFEEVIAILKGRGFQLEELSERKDEFGNLIVIINGAETILDENGDIPASKGKN